MYVDNVNASHMNFNAFNAMYVNAVNAKDIDSTHILAHNFLNIQLIFNLEKLLES